MAHVWEKSYPSGVHWDCPLPPAVPLEGSSAQSATQTGRATRLLVYPKGPPSTRFFAEKFST